MKNPLDSKIALFVKGIEKAKKHFAQQSAKATKKYVAMRDRARGELKKTFTNLTNSLRKCSNEISRAKTQITKMISSSAEQHKSSGNYRTPPSQAAKPKNWKKGTPDTKGSKQITKATKQAKGNNSLTISSDANVKSKYQVNKDKNKNISVDTGLKPKSKPKPVAKELPRPPEQKPKQRKKRRKSNSRSRKRGSGGLGNLSAGIKDFDNMVGKISQIQNSVSGMITSIDKAVATGDLTPVVDELAKIPGPIGKIASVASSSYKIGNQMYEFYMKNMGGQENFDNDVKKGQNYVNKKKFAKKDRSLKNQRNARFEEYVNFLRQVNQITKKQAEGLRKQYYFGKNNVKKGNAYTEVSQMTRAVKRKKSDKQRLGKKYTDFEAKEAANKANNNKTNKAHQDKINRGEIKAGSDQDFALRQNIILEQTSKLRQLLEDAKKLNIKPKIDEYKKKIAENNNEFNNLDKQRTKAAEQRETGQMLSKTGQTTQNKINNAKRKRDQLEMEAGKLKKDLKRAPKGKRNKIKKRIKQIAKESQVEVENIKKLEKEKRGASANIAGGSGKNGGKGDGKCCCCEKLEKVRELLAKSPASSKVKQEAKAALKVVEAEIKKKTSPQSADESSGFRGEVSNVEKPTKKEVAKQKLLSMIEEAKRARTMYGFNKMGTSGKRRRGKAGSRYRFKDIPAFHPEPLNKDSIISALAPSEFNVDKKFKSFPVAGKARAAMDISTGQSGTTQQSNGDLHRTMKEVVHVLKTRLPDETFGR